MTPKSETPNQKESINTSAEYSSRVKSITTKPLSVETIDTYASSALDELIQLAEDVVEQYEQNSPVETATKLETENSAFEYFGLDNINDLLEHIAKIASDIDTLDEVIATITVDTPRVILPPESRSLPPKNTGDSYVAPGVSPRLKTLLFLLQQHFGIDIQPNTTDVTIINGVLDKNSMRKVGYRRVIIPQLKREVLICDEERNTTFVLRSDEFVDTTIDDLCDMGKSEISQRLRDDPLLGKKIRYSDKYVQNIIRALSGDDSLGLSTSTEFLTPAVPAPEGIFSRPAIMQELGGLDWHFAQRLIDEASANPEFGEIGVYRFGNVSAKGYTRSQQAIIRSVLEAQPEKPPKPPEGVISIITMAKSIGITDITCRNYVAHLQQTDPEFGEVNTYLFRTTPGIGLDQLQQQKVLSYAEKKFHQPPDESITSTGVVAEQVGVSFNTLARHLQRIMSSREDFGEIGVFAFGKRKAGQGLTDAQREIVFEEMSGISSARQAPEGVYSCLPASEKIGISSKTFTDIAAKLSASDPDFGPIEKYLFVKMRGRGYTERQIELVAEEVKRRRSNLGNKALDSSNLPPA